MSIVAKRLDGSRCHLVTKVDLGPRHILLRGDPAPPKELSPQFSAHLYLWPNGRPSLLSTRYLWPPCVADAGIIFLPCGFFFLFSSPNLSRRRWDVYHTSTYGVALVRI